MRDKQSPFFSIVMPAYNAEKFITDAIDSVISQSFKDWELIIVDDCSSDNTFEIISTYAEKDARIIFERRPKNSGSAFIPRKQAVLMARSNWILYLDADDYLNEDYLSKLYVKICETDSDVVLGKMIFVTEKGDSLGINLPCDGFDISKSYNGRELVKETLNGWNIGANCIAVTNNILLNALKNFKSTSSAARADEVLTRYVFLNSCKVSFTDAEYYYRCNPNSITNKLSIKIFDILDSNLFLCNLIENEFGQSSEEMSRVAVMQFHDTTRCWIIYFSNDFLPSDKKIIEEKIKYSYKNIRWPLLKGYVHPLKYYAMYSGLHTFKYMYKIYGLFNRRK